MFPVLRFKRLAASLCLAACAASGTARADTIYDFIGLATTSAHGSSVPLDISFQLDLHDDFVPEAFDRQCYANGCSGTGNFDDFTLSLSINGSVFGELGSIADKFGETDIGNINASSGSLAWDTSSNDVSLTFGQGVWTAVVNNDFIAAQCGQPGCTASGTLAEAVPEPSTLAVLGVGVLGLGFARRRRSSRDALAAS